MTQPRDPVEAWLSTDVDLLPPSASAFERIHRRARRRRAIRTAGAACGAAAVIAAAVIVPQVAGNLLPNGGGPNKLGNGPLPSPSRRNPPASPGPHGPVARSQGRGPALATAGTGVAAAPGFSPTSVTFINGGALGAVIGQARCPAGPCTAVAGTADYGQRWARIGAPQAGSPAGSSGVSQIRFGDTRDGWAYGPALYATHDGGAKWRPVRLGGRVTDLSVVASRVFAVVANCSGPWRADGAGCTSFSLYQAAAADPSNRWQRVRGASAAGQAAPGGLQLTPAGGYLLAGRLLFAGPVTGAAWHRVSAVSASAPECLRTPRAVPGPALIAPSGAQLYLACAAAPAGGSVTPGRLMLYYSPDGGQTWHLSGPVPARGTATSLAAIPGGAIVLATTSGIDYTFDAAHWHQARLAGPAPPGGFSFVGMTTTANGVAVPASSAARALFITTDGGVTWAPSPISR